MYQRFQLPSTNIGDPGPLPEDLLGLPDDVLGDLSAHLDPDACEQLGYVGQGFLFVEDPPPPAPPVIISPYDFLLLFSTSERIAIRTAAQASPAVADWLDLLNHVPDVHLDVANTIGGVQALESAGLIGAGRSAQILANEPPP